MHIPEADRVGMSISLGGFPALAHVAVKDVLCQGRDGSPTASQPCPQQETFCVNTGTVD